MFLLWLLIGPFYLAWWCAVACYYIIYWLAIAFWWVLVWSFRLTFGLVLAIFGRPVY